MEFAIHRQLNRRMAATIAVLFALFGGTATAQSLDSYRKLWSDPALNQRIDRNIEKYRKGDATIEIVGQDGQAVQGASVEVRQQTHEFLFGCNAFVLGQLGTPEKNRKYEEAFVRLFNFATVPFYWEGIEPKEGELRYAEGGRDMWRRPPPDRYLPFAKQYGITLKGHPLLWHAYNPSWLPKDAESLKKLYQKRFAEIARRYAKDIKIWDGVNESLCSSKAYPLHTTDRAYVAWAFREIAPLFGADSLLMINEVNFSNLSAGAANPYYRQVKQLLADGVGVKGIGFQFHFFSPDTLNKELANPGYAPQKLLDAYDSFGTFKLPLFITEITVPTPHDNGPAVQAELVGNFYRLWFSVPQMAGITWWNLGDGTAVKGENRALGGLVDENLAPKESYCTLDRLINREWKTRLSAKTDAQGVLRFRGFYGKYAVKVTAGDKTQEFSIDLSKSGSATHHLVLRP
jgi:GH35 family endo-1,4-beta-xylanase